MEQLALARKFDIAPTVSRDRFMRFSSGKARRHFVALFVITGGSMLMRPGLTIRWQKRVVTLLEMVSETDKRTWWLVRVEEIDRPMLDYIWIYRGQEDLIEIIRDTKEKK